MPSGHTVVSWIARSYKFDWAPPKRSDIAAIHFRTHQLDLLLTVPQTTQSKMKFFIVLAVIASASAIPYGGLVNTGASAVSRSEDGYGNYAFGYNEDHATGGTFRKEKGGPGVQVGSYGLRDADGRVRVVNYVADALGFRASVSTNEPGTDVKQDPAATNLNYGGGHIAAPLVAPIAVAHGPIGYAAPLAYAAPIATSYSVSTAHGAPLLHGAPLIANGYGHGLHY